ncbi:heavy-metal-associated domain-containing protein [Stappia indica]|uniref:Copper chaperone n=1 Tax=Stappia indica TaxID=538381 RepID=A0A285SNI3_9HYPH|nr:heavy metal-associated domain-containing protein [Stappia indica]SOC09366.1 copper chaperone [Stappia indica]
MIEVKIDGMTCNGCVASVKKALAAADPASSTEIDLASGTARIETQMPRDRVVETIEAAGYDVVAG